jgi:hypothetical protein
VGHLHRSEPITSVAFQQDRSVVKTRERSSAQSGRCNGAGSTAAQVLFHEFFNHLAALGGLPLVGVPKDGIFLRVISSA